MPKSTGALFLTEAGLSGGGAADPVLRSWHQVHRPAGGCEVGTKRRESAKSIRASRAYGLAHLVSLLLNQPKRSVLLELGNCELGVRASQFKACCVLKTVLLF